MNDPSEVEVESTHRLGKKSEVRGRPIRVITKSEQQKWKLIAQATKIRNVEITDYDPERVFIVPDLTKLEREKELELRKQLLAKRDAHPNEVFKIKKGRSSRSPQKPQRKCHQMHQWISQW